MSRFVTIAVEIGELVKRKNAAYGSSFAKTGAFLRLLYPEGLAPAQYGDALLVTRIFDKLQRIATNRDALGESPYRDIAGYGILGALLHEGEKEVGSQSGLSKAVPAPGVHRAGPSRSGSLLLGRVPHEGLSRAARPQTGKLSPVRIQPAPAGKTAARKVGRR